MTVTPKTLPKARRSGMSWQATLLVISASTFVIAMGVTAVILALGTVQ